MLRKLVSQFVELHKKLCIISEVLEQNNLSDLLQSIKKFVLPVRRLTEENVYFILNSSISLIDPELAKRVKYDFHCIFDSFDELLTSYKELIEINYKKQQNFLRKNGPLRIYLQENLLCECNFVNNELHGLYRSYYNEKYRNTTGPRLSQIRYINGVKQGYEKRWYKNGQLLSRQRFHDNIKNGFFIKWHTNGVKFESGIYKNDRIDGLYTSFYTDGTTKTIINYKNGNKHGTIKTYHKDGKLHTISEYKNGKLHGNISEYCKNGQIKYHKSFSENFIEEWYYYGLINN